MIKLQLLLLNHPPESEEGLEACTKCLRRDSRGRSRTSNLMNHLEDCWKHRYVVKVHEMSLGKVLIMFYTVADGTLPVPSLQNLTGGLERRGRPEMKRKRAQSWRIRSRICYWKSGKAEGTLVPWFKLFAVLLCYQV